MLIVHFRIPNVMSDPKYLCAEPCIVVPPYLSQWYSSLAKLRLNEACVQFTEIVRPWNVTRYHSVCLSPASSLQVGWLFSRQTFSEELVCVHTVCVSPIVGIRAAGTVLFEGQCECEDAVRSVNRSCATSGVCSFSWIFHIFQLNSKKLGVQVPGNIELKIYFRNFTSISLVLFLHVLVIYNTVSMLFKKQQQNTSWS